MKVKITTQDGEFIAELDKDMTPAKLFPEVELVSFTTMNDEGNPVRMTVLKSLIRIVEEDL